MDRQVLLLLGEERLGLVLMLVTLAFLVPCAVPE